MGKRNFLVDGVSCSGKTSVATELQRRGYSVVHGDRELKYRGDRATGEAVDVPSSFPDDQSRAVWVSEHLCWPADTVAALAADDTEPVTFFCGGSRNSHQFLHLFDAVFVLDIDRETLIRRLDDRPADDWGGQGRQAERELVLRLQQTKEDLPDGIVIDATQPLADVVDEILRRCGTEPAAPMPQEDRRRTPAELAASITAADRPSKPQPERLRLQWNVPRGVQPHIPLWFSLLFLALLAIMIASSLLNR